MKAFSTPASTTAGLGFAGVFEPPAPVEPEPAVPPQVTGVPQRWTDVGVGSLVLATTGEENVGWFEAVVAECKAENVLALRWSGWPDEPEFLQALDGVALLPAATAQQIETTSA